MKKQVAMLFFVSILLLTGCETGTKKEDTAKPEKEVSNNTVEKKVKSQNYEKLEGDLSTQTRIWETFEMTINETNIKLNETRLQELLDIGYALDDTYSKPKEVQPKDHAEFLINPGIEDTNLESYQYFIQVNVANEKDTVQNVKDCLVTGLAHRNDAEKYKEILLPGNISMDSSEQDIIDAYGEPNTTLVYDNGFKDISYICKDNKVILRFEMEDGKINFFSIAYGLNPYAQ